MSNPGATLVLARGVCRISKTDFDRMAQYYAGVIGEDANHLKGNAATPHDTLGIDELVAMDRRRLRENDTT